MPTYQYACTDQECATRFELVQSFTDPSASACPVCAGPVRKVYGSVGVVFKGSGFYRNDSRAAAEGEGKDRKGTREGSGDTEASSQSKTESTPSAESSNGKGAKSDSTPSKSDGTPSKSDATPSKSDGTPAKSDSSAKAPAKASA